MAVLNDDVKLFIVRALACFDAPTEVTRQVKEEFGIDVTRQQVSAYDPNRRIGKSLSKKLRAVFEQTRKAFLDDVSTIPIANQAYRLRAISKMYEKCAVQGNIAVAAQLIEQAAKEIGGSYTNRREITGKDGGPILHRKAHELTDDELATIAAGGSAGTANPEGGAS